MAIRSFHPFDENYILQDADKIRQFLKTLRVVAPKTTIYYPDELNGPEKGDKYDEADGLHTAKGYIYKKKETLKISIRSPAGPENLGTVNSTNNMHHRLFPRSVCTSYNYIQNFRNAHEQFCLDWNVQQNTTDHS